MPSRRWLKDDVVRLELWINDELKKEFYTSGERIYRDRAWLKDYYQNFLKKKKWEIFIIAIPNE
jgi:hypothetical protein